MYTIDCLIDAYINLLKIKDIKTRLELNYMYCVLRDKIAELTNKSSQYVQEKYEEITLKFKNQSKSRLVSFYITLSNKIL